MIDTQTFTSGHTPPEAIAEATNRFFTEAPVFRMSLIGAARETMTAMVNQGIDSHVEAFAESSFEDDGRRMHVRIRGAQDMRILLRRLDEAAARTRNKRDDAARLLRTDLLGILGIEEI